MFFSLPFDEAILAYLTRHPEILISPNDLYELYWERGATLAEAAAAQLHRDVHASLGEALRVGVPMTEWREKAAREWGGTHSYYETVYRTNVAQAYSDGQRNQAAEYPDVIGFRRLTTRDSTTRPNHRAAHGMVYAKDDPRADWKAAPWGFNCFPAGVAVQGTFDGASRAFYCGQIVELTTQHGARLSVTPNHPVATVNGLVPAGLIQRGEKLLRYQGEVVSLATDEVHEHDVPATVEQVFAALAEDRQVLAIRPVAVDFHGDAAGFHGEVDVVGTFGHLWSGLVPGALDDGLQPVLELAAARDKASVAERHPDARLVALRPALDGGMSGGNLSRASGSGHPGPLQPLRFGPAANCRTRLADHGGNRRSAVTGFTGESENAHASNVTLDEVLTASHREFCGHVYDLHSPFGFIVAEGIVTSNCRCTDVPVTRAMARRYGIVFDESGEPVLPEWPAEAHPDEGFK